MVTSIFKSGRRSRQRTAAMRKPNPAQWFDNAQLALGWAIILLIAGIASAFYLFEVSQTDIIGNRANVMAYELDLVRNVNAELMQQIANERSIVSIKDRASTLTLPYQATDPATIEYITVVVPAPQQVAAEDTAPALVIPPETIQEVLLIELERLLLSVEGVFGAE